VQKAATSMRIDQFYALHLVGVGMVWVHYALQQTCR
jgi:hypothetical protein